MKDKMKSYSFWTALSGAVVVLLQAIGDCFGFSVQSEIVSGIIMAIAGILVVFGVVSMPNNSQNNDNNSTGDESTNSNEVDAEINDNENSAKNEMQNTSENTSKEE